MKWVHDLLTFIIECYKKNPWEAEEQNEAIKDKEGGKSWFLGFFVGSVEPENL